MTCRPPCGAHFCFVCGERVLLASRDIGNQADVLASASLGHDVSGIILANTVKKRATNPMANPMTMTTAIVSIGSGVLQDDGFDDVGDVLDGVEGRLHRLHDVLPVQRRARLELV